ncbi:MAG: hypothetical protein WBN41_10375, partial [Lysobacterales bacterium]
MQHPFPSPKLQFFPALTQHIKSLVIKSLAAIACCLVSSAAWSQDLVITGVVDGPLSGGVPKAVEIYVINNVADMSVCGLGG